MSELAAVQPRGTHSSRLSDNLVDMAGRLASRTPTRTLCSECENDCVDSFTTTTVLSEHEQYEIVKCNLCTAEIMPDDWQESVRRQTSSKHPSSGTEEQESISTGHCRLSPLYDMSESAPQLRNDFEELDLHSIDFYTQLGDLSLAEPAQTRPSALLSEDFCYTSRLQRESMEAISMESLNDILSMAPCQNCGHPTVAVKGSRGEILVWYCKTCCDCTGVDDSFSVPDALDLVEKLVSLLENNELRTEACASCGNCDPYKFRLTQLSCQSVIVCDVCDTRCLNCVDDLPIPGLDSRNSFPGYRTDTSEPNYQWDSNSTEKKIVDQEPIIDSSDTCHGGRCSYKPPSGRTRIRNLAKLKPADHIAWDRPYAVWHHAIVERVDLKTNELHVIHNSGVVKPSVNIGIFKECVKVNFKRDPHLFRMDYMECHPPEIVLSRAESRIGEHMYNIFMNNCEHFAQWCKTGQSWSDQVKNMKESLALKAADVAALATKDGFKLGRYLAQNTADEVANLVGAAKGTARAAMRTLGKADIVTGAFVVGFEIVRTGIDIHRSYKDMKNEKISKGEFVRFTLKRAVQGIGGAAGSIIGGIIGSFVPIPILGTLVGGSIGGLLGEFFGKIIGRQIVQKL